MSSKPPEALRTDLESQCVFRCDGCGVKAAGDYFNGHWFKPSNWYQRSDGDGAQLACSRRCIDKVAVASGKTSVVLPV